VKQLRVVEIITPYRIVINAGREEGIREGMQFEVYALGKELTDPDTGQALEKLEIMRGRGQAIHVQNKISTIVSTEGGYMPPFASLGSSTMFYTTRALKDTQLTLMPFEKVQIGDFVRAISIPKRVQPT